MLPIAPGVVLTKLPVYMFCSMTNSCFADASTPVPVLQVGDKIEFIKFVDGVENLKNA